MNILVTAGAEYIESNTVAELLVDLTKGHLKALNATQANKGANLCNLGTEQGHIVIEVINDFEKVSGKTIEYKMSLRRVGAVFSRQGIKAVEAGTHRFVSHIVTEYPELDFDVWMEATL